MSDAEFVATVAEELKRPRNKFPGSNATFAAFVEEVGEVGKALMCEPWNDLVREAVQVACMAQRLATEGDVTMRAFRNKNVHQFGERHMLKEHLMPEV